MSQHLLFGSALVAAVIFTAGAGLGSDQVAAAAKPVAPVKTPTIPKAPVMWPNPQMWRGGLQLGPNLAPPPFIPTRPGLDPSWMAILSGGTHLTAPGYTALLDLEFSFLMTHPLGYPSFEERLLFGRRSFADSAMSLGLFDILRMTAPEIYYGFDHDLAPFLGRDPFFSRAMNRYPPALGLGSHLNRPSSMTTLLGLPARGSPFMPGRLADPFGLDPLLMSGMQDFMPWTARRSLSMAGIPQIPGFNGGFGPGFDPMMNRGLIGGLRYGSPLDRLLLPGGGMGIPGFPTPRRSMVPFGNPYPVYPVPAYRTPVGGTQRPAPPPDPSEEQRAFLREFQNELTRIETLAQKKSWQELEKPVQEVLGLPELPTGLSDALKAVRSGAEQLQSLEGLRAAVRNEPKDVPDADAVGRLLERLRAATGDPEFTQKVQDRLSGAAVPGDLAAEMDGHIQALELDIRVRLVDVGRYRDRAGKLAGGEQPRKQPDGNPADKVAELLGRSPTPVERLLILRMQADRKTPEEMAQILKESK